MTDASPLPTPSLLGTKLFIPRARKETVPRPRLTTVMHEALRRRFTLISAPAGFGKTTLMSEWIPQSERCVTWLSLERSDNDLTRFLTYLIASLQTLRADLGAGTAERLQSPVRLPIETIMTDLINEVHNFPDVFAFVLDDYHVIETREIHEAMGFLVDHLPANMHLVMLSRSDPAFPISRLRARREMTELRAADLRFTQSESGTFLHDVMNVSIAENDVDTLTERTEGWIAGLQLAALSMQGEHDAASFVRGFAGNDRHVLDYLIEEVLQSQPEEVQRFLLETSIPDRVCGQLADRLTGESNSGQMLERLEGANLFLFPLDNVREWYRYHHLFADLLRARLLRQRPEHVIELHMKASAWFEEGRYLEEAIHHALTAGAWERAAGLIQEIAPDLLSRWQHSLIEQWIRPLPVNILDQRPDLCNSLAAAYMQDADLDKSEEYLQRAERAWKNEPGGHQLALVWGRRAVVGFGRGDGALAMTSARNAVKYAHPGNIHDEFVSLFGLAAAFIVNGMLPDAEETLQRTVAITERMGVFGLTFAAWTQLGHIQMMRGLLRRAVGTLRMCVERDQIVPDLAGATYGLLCGVAIEQNDLDAAERYCHEGATLLRQSESTRGWPMAHLAVQALVWMMWQKGEREEALRLIGREREIDEKNRNEAGVQEKDGMRILLSLWDGDLVTAKHLVRELGFRVDGSFSFARETAHFAYLRLLFAEEKYDEVIALSTRYQQAAEPNDRMRAVIELMVIRAMSHKGRGETGQAVDVLLHAMRLSEPNGFCRVFVNEGAPMVELLRECARALRKSDAGASEDAMTTYAEKLLGSFPGELTAVGGRKARVPSDAPGAYLLDPLSDREIEVLQLVAAGLSNPEIAGKLYLSTGTVKRHVNNIYLKLNVHSRIEAVQKARELKVLSPG